MAAICLDLLESASEVDVAEQRASTRRRNRSIGRRSQYSLTETQFRKRYRLSKELFEELVEELRPHIRNPVRSDGLDVETKTPIGDNTYHPVSQTSVSKAVKEVTEALNKPADLNRHVAFPFRRSDRENIKRRFFRDTKLPGVVGCVDGTHVAIFTPSEHEERFVNRKGYHSLNVLIICDADLKIMTVDSSYPGSTHDSKVWEGNKLKQYIEKLNENLEDLYILGDSGYPLRKTMMTPIANAELGSPDAYYTELQVSARSRVERCIGVLQARFS